MGEAPFREDSTVTRSAEYVGSFPVEDNSLDAQIYVLHKQLKSLRTCRRRMPVCLKFSIKGLKMYNEDETTLLMAHALHRISLSTARPADAQFAFVSHNPGSADAPQLYCHVFEARHARAAQFLNLLLCRCFQLLYLEKHPDEAQDESAPQNGPSLLNHGFPLSVSALVSFRRAPFQGFFLSKKSKKSPESPQSSRDDVFTVSSSPSLMRKKAIRPKELRSGAYRSFTFTPLKQRGLQERLSLRQEKDQNKKSSGRARTPSLAETEEALAQEVWAWAGIATNSSSALLADDVLGSYLLCSHPKKPKSMSLIIRLPLGLTPVLIKNSHKGKFSLEKSKMDFVSMAELIEYYTETQGELPCPLSCARVNHCYEWEESPHTLHPPKLCSIPSKRKTKRTQRKEWI